MLFYKAHTVYIYISNFSLQISRNTKRLIVGMTFGVKCYCWSSKPTIPKLKSWEENVSVTCGWRIDQDCIWRWSKPALIPCEQAWCYSFKGRWRLTGGFLHFGSSSQRVALHVNLSLHHKKHHWAQRLRLYKTMPKSYSCNDLNQKREGGKQLESWWCTCKTKINPSVLLKLSDPNETGIQKEIFCVYQWQAYINTRVVNLTSYHYVTVGSPALSGALSLPQCLKTRLAALNENPPDRLAWSL